MELREQDGQIIGHAWVLVDDVSIVEPKSDLVRFMQVLRFGARGTILSQVRADQASDATNPIPAAR
jgi:hypothetical protein